MSFNGTETEKKKFVILQIGNTGWGSLGPSVKSMTTWEIGSVYFLNCEFCKVSVSPVFLDVHLRPNIFLFEL